MLLIYCLCNYIAIIIIYGGAVNNPLHPITYTGVAVLFSHLPIEQYRTIAWFNMASGLALLLLFVFLFRGEASWRSRVSHCQQCCLRTANKSEFSLRPLQVFISCNRIHR